MMHRGFIALTSVLVLSAALLALTIGAGSAVLYARFDALDAERKAESAALARSCLGVLSMKLYDPSYGGAETFPLSGGTCAISSAEREGEKASFMVSAEDGNAATAFSVRTHDGSIESAVEIPNAGPH